MEPPKRRNVLCFVECFWQPVPESGRCIAKWPFVRVLFDRVLTQRRDACFSGLRNGPSSERFLSVFSPSSETQGSHWEEGQRERCEMAVRKSAFCPCSHPVQRRLVCTWKRDRENEMNCMGKQRSADIGAEFDAHIGT